MTPAAPPAPAPGAASGAAFAAAWPVAGIVLRTERLELRPVRDADLPELAAAARGGIHDDARMPFVTGWTDAPPEEWGRRFTQYFWRRRATWSRDAWGLPFAVRLRATGEAIGVQELKADGFPVLREVRSGSWLASAHQRQGYGTEMRGAVLELAFTGLGAEVASTSAYLFNAGSLGVSERLGYVRTGVRRDAVRGRAEEAVLLRLPRWRWEKTRGRPVVEIAGLDAACLELLGVA